MTSSSHYYDNDPRVKSEPSRIGVRIEDIDFIFTSDSGVFSKQGVDFGSMKLIETFISERKEGTARGTDILDIGCGYGPVGIIIKRIFPEISLTMTDINTRAVDLAKKNALENNISFAKILVSDAFSEIEDDYDIILINPPIRAGKKTVFDLYAGSYEHLRKNGIIYSVVQNKQGAQSTFNELYRLFGNCEVVSKKAGYRVMKSVKGESK